MNQRRAFTLIELLVVVAIIMLLAALLLPALKNARESAKQTACAGNLRQIGLAFQSYFSDNEDHFPPVWDTTVGPWSPIWAQMLYPYLNGPQYTAGQLTASLPVFHCSSITIDSAYTKWIVWIQYGYNHLSLGSSGVAGYPLGTRLPDIRQPVEHLMVTETTDEAALPPNNSGYIAGTGNVCARHKALLANTLFVDSHVESRQASQLANSNPFCCVPFNYSNY